eukprot:1304032-Amphidinium_carterae.1
MASQSSNVSFKDASETVSMPDMSFDGWFEEGFGTVNEGQSQLQQQTARVSEHLQQTLEQQHLQRLGEQSMARDIITQQSQAFTVAQDV